MLPTPNQQPRPQPANPRQTVRISPLLPTPNQQPPRQQTSTLTPWQRLSHLHITRDLRVSHSHQQLVANLQPAGGAYSLVDTRAACRLLGT